MSLILVVDDNPTNLRLTSFVLEKAGYEIRTCGDAPQALAILAEVHPALILMDLQLPGIDGLELTRQLRKDPARADITILALTAFAMKGDEQRAREAGCDGYIAKPVTPTELRRVVADHLSSPRQPA